MKYIAGEFFNFPEIFKKIPENKKSEGLNNAKLKLERDFKVWLELKWILYLVSYLFFQSF